MLLLGLAVWLGQFSSCLHKMAYNLTVDGTFCGCYNFMNSMINPLNPIVHFWLHHTVHCAEKIVPVRYARWFCVSRKGEVGQGEVVGVTLHGGC